MHTKEKRIELEFLKEQCKLFCRISKKYLRINRIVFSSLSCSNIFYVQNMVRHGYKIYIV